VAATGSDDGRRGLAPRVRRLSLRLRLTVLYGTCFVLAGAAILAVTYGLVAHDTSGQTRSLQAHDARGQEGQDFLQVPEFGGRGQLIDTQRQGFVVQFPVPLLTRLSGPRYTDAQLAKVRIGALEYSQCMRTHGVANYPNAIVARGPGGHSLEVGTPRGAPPFDFVSRTFKSANHECGPRLDRYLLPSHRGSFQQQLKLLTDRSNGALTTQRDRTLRALLTWSGIALAVMALISIVLGWVMGGRALGPMRKMSARARRITEENLHERLSTDTQDGEVGELATTFDGVLARLERAFAAQKRFVANASHELRTPVTVERTLLEVALADPDTDAETLRRTCERVLVSTKEQQTTIEALLALARSQGGTDVEAPVDLADVAQDAVTLREQRFDHLTLATDLHSAPLTGDPALLERLVSNLIENAIVHNVADGWISIETGHERSGSWLRVSNSGAEVPEAMVSEIFEPFRRIDGERTATATGLGLGLSIVQAIADVHGATVQASPVEGGGLRVEVRF
jgi:signal transduction histidine kinase